MCDVGWEGHTALLIVWFSFIIKSLVICCSPIVWLVGCSQVGFRVFFLCLWLICDISTLFMSCCYVRFVIDCTDTIV